MSTVFIQYIYDFSGIATTAQQVIIFFYDNPCCATILLGMTLFMSRRIIAFLLLASIAALLKVALQAIASALLTPQIPQHLNEWLHPLFNF